MQRGPVGHFEVTSTRDEAVRAFVPAPLPPAPLLELTGGRQRLLEQALLACGRLDGITTLLPDPDLFLYAYVRREAVLSSQIEGTRSSLSDLLLFEHSSMLNTLVANGCALIVPKAKIAANGDYNLSGERYRQGAARNHSYPLISLGDQTIFRVEGGGTPKSGVQEYWGGEIPWATLVDLPAADFISQITTTKRTISDKGLRESSAKLIPADSVVVSTRATIGRIAINRVAVATNQGFKNIVIEDATRAMSEYVALALTKLVQTMRAWATGGTFAEISKSKFCEFQIPLPPLEVQKELVAEIEGYQKVIDGARAVLDNYRPHIPTHPDWPMVELASVVRFQEGPGILAKDFRSDGIPLVRLAGLGGANVTLDGCNYLEPEMAAQKWKHFRLRVGDILVSTSASFGRPAVVDSTAEGAVFYTGLIRFQPKDNNLDAGYLKTFLGSPAFLDQGQSFATGSSIKHFGPMHLK